MKILGRRERTEEEKQMQDAPYLPLFPAVFSYVAGPLFPVIFEYVGNVGRRYFGEVLVDVSRCIIHMFKYTTS